MTPGFAKSRSELPWLPYGETDRVIINAHNFTPAFITMLDLSPALWLDGSDASTLYDATSGGSLVAANGAIARWQDKSASAAHVTQSTAGSRPARKTSVQNGLDAVLFDGGDVLRNTVNAVLPDGPKTIVAMLKSANGVGGTVFNSLCATNGTARYVARLLRIGLNYIAGDTISNNATTSYDFSTAFQSAFLVSFTLNSSRNSGFWTHGTSQSTSGTIGVDNTITGFQIGSLIDGSGTQSQLWNGHIMELAAFASELSTLNRQKAEGILAHKWGTTASLDASHPYKSVAP